MITKVHTACFFDKVKRPDSDTHLNISIARSKPACAFDMLEIAKVLPTEGGALVPEAWLLGKYKQERMSWDSYTAHFRSHVEEVLTEVGGTWGLEGGLAILGLLDRAARAGKPDKHITEVTLYCWEHANNPQCHRKLVYDMIHEAYQGDCL